MTKARDSLGQRIRLRRKSVGLSLRELAAKAGVTASFISQVERGQTNPSIDSLRRIAEALQVSILHFLSDHVLAQPKSVQVSAPFKYVPIVRANARSKLTLPGSGVTYELLTPDLAHKMEAFCGCLSPGTGNVARRLREPTEELIYVLSGSLCVGLDSEEHTLHAGDSIYFEGVALRKLACASKKQDAVWISVITPPVF
jgi:transcriptional regulator with XRE-family HTH domain